MKPPARFQMILRPEGSVWEVVGHTVMMSIWSRDGGGVSHEKHGKGPRVRRDTETVIECIDSIGMNS